MIKGETLESYRAKTAGYRVKILRGSIHDLPSTIVIPGENPGETTEHGLLFSGLPDQCRQCRKFGHIAKYCDKPKTQREGWAYQATKTPASRNEGAGDQREGTMAKGGAQTEEPTQRNNHKQERPQPNKETENPITKQARPGSHLQESHKNQPTSQERRGKRQIKGSQQTKHTGGIMGQKWIIRGASNPAHETTPQLENGGGKSDLSENQESRKGDLEDEANWPEFREPSLAKKAKEGTPAELQ